MIEQPEGWNRVLAMLGTLYAGPPRNRKVVGKAKPRQVPTLVYAADKLPSGRCYPVELGLGPPYQFAYPDKAVL